MNARLSRSTGALPVECRRDVFHCAKDLDCVNTEDQDILYGFSIEIRDLLHNSEGRYLDPLSITCGLPDDDMTRLDILEEVEELATKYLRTPLANVSYHKLNFSDIQRRTKAETKARKYLKSVTEICSAMRVSLRNGQNKVLHCKSNVIMASKNLTFALSKEFRQHMVASHS